MAVSKRLRHEVMRRDNHTCRYCGATAPDVKLTIDHVTPTTLGGSDEPDNLVTACADCNAGKSSIVPGAPLVDDVAQDALRWSRAQEFATTTRALQRENRKILRQQFCDLWDDWTREVTDRVDGRLVKVRRSVALSSGWEDTVDNFYAAGASLDDFEEAIRIAMTARNCQDEFRYFCGVMWKFIREIQDTTAALLASGAIDDADMFVDDVAPHVDAAAQRASERTPDDTARLGEILGALSRAAVIGGDDGA